MNKKGFTLIELLAVIAIIALISLIAIPNIVSLSNNIRKDQMIDDAKKLISNAKYLVSKSYDIRTNPPKVFTFEELNANGDIKNDPDGGDYDRGTSKVTYYRENSTEKYCIYLESERRKICKMSEGCDLPSCCTLCVEEDELYSHAKVIDK